MAKKHIVVLFVAVLVAALTGIVVANGMLNSRIENLSNLDKDLTKGARLTDTGVASLKAYTDALQADAVDGTTVVDTILLRYMNGSLDSNEAQLRFSSMQVIQNARIIQQNDEIIRLLKKQVGETK